MATEERRLHWAAFANKSDRVCWADAVTWAMFESPESLSECTVKERCFDGNEECWCGKHRKEEDK